MNLYLLGRIKRIIRNYFEKGKPDKLKTEGFDEIKRLIWRQGGFWKDYKPLMKNIISEIQEELKQNFYKGHLRKIDDIIKSQLAEIINITSTTLRNKAGEAQKIIASALEKSYINGGKWEDYARRGFNKIKLEERHIKTEIETAKAALNNLRRYKNFKEAGDKEIYYRYEGPDTVRPFCVAHLNKVYSLTEISQMRNNFGQPAFAYCGGYNCRHRWAPTLGKKEGKLFVEKSWEKKYNSASKNEKKVMTRELDFARKAAKQGYAVELNYGLRKKSGKDTDLIFDGKYAQLKQPTTININSLGRLPRSDQADLIIVELEHLPEDYNFERLEGKYKSFLDDHPGKTIFLFYNNNFKEIKND